MAIGAVRRGQVSDVNRVFEGLGWQRGDLRATFLLLQHGMAGVAILTDDLAVFAHVVAIMAAEAALVVHVPDVVGMRLPVHLHVGEESGGVDALQFGDCTLDAVRFGRSELGILVLVELGDVGGDCAFARSEVL